jgi:hypothetical protein
MQPTPLTASPNGGCRRHGHRWDIERPSVFAPTYEPPAETIVSTCERCGTTRTDKPDGARFYSYGVPA